MQKQIAEIINKAIKDKVFPGCVVGVIKNGQKKIFPFGRFSYDDSSSFVKEDTIYDVASVTKAIPASCLLLALVDRGKIKLEDCIADYLPEFNNYPGKDKVLVKHLLTYTVDLDVPPMSSLKKLSADEIIRIIIGAPLKFPAGEKFLYANSTAVLTGLIIKKITGKMADVLAEEFFFKPLEMKKTTFHPLKIFKKEEIAPSEICDWRGRIIQGEVHDESTFVLQEKYFFGVAGLFSAAPDLLVFLEMLLNNGEKYGRRFFSKNILKQMHTNQLAEIGECTGLGWQLNQSLYMGRYSTANTCGKRGFTGSFVLWDVSKKAGMAMLANRTYPKRPVDNSAINEVRRALADVVLA